MPRGAGRRRRFRQVDLGRRALSRAGRLQRSLRALAGEGEHDLRGVGRRLRAARRGRRTSDAKATHDRHRHPRHRRRTPPSLVPDRGRARRPMPCRRAGDTARRPSGSGTRAAPSGCPTRCCAASWPSWQPSPMWCVVRRSTEFTRSRPRSSRCSWHRRWRVRRATSPRAVARDAERPLTFGLQVSQFTWPGGPPEIGPHFRDIARRAEAGGFDALYVMDHFRQIPTFGPPWHDMLESWTTLAHLAGCTDTVRLGTMVSGVTHRSLPLLAKIVATLDVLSGGRAICGLGIGWYEQEHHAYGWRFPPVAERYALLEDALDLLPRMWGPGSKPFDGRLLHVPDTSCYPRPLQERIPILVGGSGERRTLKLVAKGADACNLFGEPDVVRRKVETLGAIARRSGATRQRCRCLTSRRCWWARTPPRCGRWWTPPGRRRCRPSVTLERSTQAPSISTSCASNGSSMPASTTSSSASPTSPTPHPSTASRRSSPLPAPCDSR